jgi:hypothetical protein
MPQWQVNVMRFRTKLLQPRKASEPTLKKIYDVYMTPDGRVEGEQEGLAQTLEHDAAVLERLRSPKSGRSTEQVSIANWSVRRERRWASANASPLRKPAWLSVSRR